VIPKHSKYGPMLLTSPIFLKQLNKTDNMYVHCDSAYMPPCNQTPACFFTIFAGDCAPALLPCLGEAQLTLPTRLHSRMVTRLLPTQISLLSCRCPMFYYYANCYNLFPPSPFLHFEISEMKKFCIAFSNSTISKRIVAAHHYLWG